MVLAPFEFVQQLLLAVNVQRTTFHWVGLSALIMRPPGPRCWDYPAEFALLFQFPRGKTQVFSVRLVSIPEALLGGQQSGGAPQM
jgi:hypothetical protein